MDRRQPPLVIVGGEDLALVLHHGGERQRLAAGAGAEIDHLLAGLGDGEQGRKLRALVLHLDHPFQESGLGMDRRALGVGGKANTQTPRRPARRLGVQIGEHGGDRLAFGFQRVYPQIERRTRSERSAFRDAIDAEGAIEAGIEPFRIIAGHIWWRAVEARAIEPRALVVGERLRRVARAVGKLGNRICVEMALVFEHAKENSARRVRAHQVGTRRAPAQRVVDEPGNGGAVAGAGEAVREAPGFQHVGRRPPLSFNGCEYVDCSGESGCWRHGKPNGMRNVV